MPQALTVPHRQKTKEEDAREGWKERGRERNIGTERWRRQDHLTAEFTSRFSPRESGPKTPSPPTRGRRRKKKGKLEKTAEGVNNSCRQYDFFM